MIGLSATPYRTDGLDKLIDLYFGKTRFHRPLKMEHIVYKLETSFTPLTRTNRNGELDWNYILDQQCHHEKRNRMIVSICKLFPERHILILCKRVKQAEEILGIALEEHLSATSLIGSNNEFSKDAHVLIATVQKAGVGFSHDILDMLVLASDVEEYYIQYLGRVARRPDVLPIVIDIVDQNRTLKNHFRTRKKVYEEIGGSLHSFSSAFPDFHAELL
jgi:superfamily II DNA or RNA helicase